MDNSSPSSNLNLCSLISPELDSVGMVLSPRSSKYRNRILTSHHSSRYRRMAYRISKLQLKCSQMCKHPLNNSSRSKPRLTLSANLPRRQEAQFLPPYRRHVSQQTHSLEMQMYNRHRSSSLLMRLQSIASVALSRLPHRSHQRPRKANYPSFKPILLFSLRIHNLHHLQRRNYNLNAQALIHLHAIARLQIRIRSSSLLLPPLL
jgi:hypothetical protein